MGNYIIQLPLTDIQKKVLDLIFLYIEEKHYPPTIPEIQKELKINNPGNVFKILNALEKKHYIVREKNVQRSIRLTPISESILNTKKLKGKKGHEYNSTRDRY